MLGGLVEGTALGVIQAVLLGRVLPRLRRRTYAAVTVLVAGLGWALRGAVSHPWRWLTANAVAWPPAMAVIFLGATTPGRVGRSRRCWVSQSSPG